MKPLVLGNRGFVGTHTVRRMKELNLNPILLDQKIKDGETPRWESGADSVLHLCWYDVWSDEAETAEKNIRLTRQVLEASRRSDTKHIVFPSTVSVDKEGASGVLDEDRTISCNSPYSKAKLMSEDIIKEFCEQHGMTYVILRYTSVYGPLQRGGFIHEIFKSLIEGSKVRFRNGRSDFVFVGDVADANILSLNYQGSGTFNIGGGVTYERRNAAEIIKGLCRSTSEIETDSSTSQDYLISIARSQQQLGYNPRVDLEKGLETTAHWYFQGMRELS